MRQPVLLVTTVLTASQLLAVSVVYAQAPPTDITDLAGKGYRMVTGAAGSDISYNGYVQPEGSNRTAAATFSSGTVFLSNNNIIMICSYKTFVPTKTVPAEPAFIAADAPHTTSRCAQLK